MSDTDRVALGLALAGIAAGFGAGVTTGRVAAHLVEEDFARVAAESRTRAAAIGSPGSDALRHKMPVTRSQPAQGPSDALVTIVEWCELYGASCRAADQLLTATLARYPLEVRRVFRHVAARSEAAERAHEIACLAEENGKFWALRERFRALDEPPDLAQLRAHGRAVGLSEEAIDRVLERREHAGDLAIDRSFAESFGVRQGPVIYVNGRRLEGRLDAATLDALVQDELEHAQDLVTNGAPRDRVYAEIIKQAASGAQRGAM